MIANITSGEDINGVIMYNETKIQKDEAEYLGSHLVVDYNLNSKKDSFYQHNINNANTKKVTFHASINLHPDVKMDNANFRKIADDYMKNMGYANQPYLIYRHFDKAHQHIHIVSSRVSKKGSKISDSLERINSQKVLIKLSEKYNIPLIKRTKSDDSKTLKNVSKSGTKNDMYNIIKFVQNNFKPTNLTEYNHFLKQYDLKVGLVKGKKDDNNYKGLVYTKLNFIDGKERRSSRDNQEETTIKSSSFNNIIQFKEIEKIFLKNLPKKKETLTRAKKDLISLKDFKGNKLEFENKLKSLGYTAIYSRNKNGINGLGFIDNKTKFYIKSSDINKVVNFNALNKNVDFNSILDKTSGLDKYNADKEKEVFIDLDSIIKEDKNEKADKLYKDLESIDKESKNKSSSDNEESQDVQKLKKKRRTL